jgi:hypothetical protein
METTTMNLHDAAADYLRFLKHEQGATATTYRTYQSGLNAFLRWLTENGHPPPTLFDFNLSTLRRYTSRAPARPSEDLEDGYRPACDRVASSRAQWRGFSNGERLSNGYDLVALCGRDDTPNNSETPFEEK